MIDYLLEKVAPYPCISCGDLNSPLCDNCKYDNAMEPFAACVACADGLALASGLCGRCRVPYSRAWCVGTRDSALRELIDRYKFYHLKAAARPLADILAIVTPELPPETVVVPIPTIRRHIRQRGYDHAALLARRIAKRKSVQYSPVLKRTTQTVQHEATRAQRIKQAKVAFRVETTLDPSVPYLIVDDIMTTGSTMKYAAQALRDAGAREVWVAALTRQVST